MNGSLEVVHPPVPREHRGIRQPDMVQRAFARSLPPNSLARRTRSSRRREERRRVSVPLPRLEACQPFPTPRQPGPSDAQVVVA